MLLYRLHLRYQISGNYPQYVLECENMAKIVCKASDLKIDDRNYKRGTFAMKSCSLCTHAAYENAEHTLYDHVMSLQYRSAGSYV